MIHYVDVASSYILKQAYVSSCKFDRMAWMYYKILKV